VPIAQEVHTMNRIFALVDCNNFYVSCERLFSASIQNKPVIVLSNNDGCVVARSNEVKALNIKMGQPVFEIRELIEKHNIVLFSSNYSLYADMSDRTMQLLSTFAHQIEVYSIDESFLDLSHVPLDGLQEYGQQIRATVWQFLGLPVSVGIATTKTLTKVATEIVKKQTGYLGVLSIADISEAELDELLAGISVEDVWGIGHRYAAALRTRDIYTAKDLKYADPHWIRRHLTVVGARTVLELRGISCIPLETKVKPKKGIMSSKSFGRPIQELQELEEAIANYTARAAEKLRDQDSLVSCINVFIQTNVFQKDAPQYSKSISKTLPFPTAFTPDLINAALEALHSIYQPGYSFKKAGVYFSKIISQESIQFDLFGDFTVEGHVKKTKLMCVVDLLNRLLGRDTLFFGAQGIGREWKMRQERRSPRYTTQWSELLSTT
jgi:DNA polymerase V